MFINSLSSSPNKIQNSNVLPIPLFCWPWINVIWLQINAIKVLSDAGMRVLLSGDQSYSPDEDRAKKAVHSFPCQSQRHEPITASGSSCIRKKADSAFLSEQCCPLMKQKKQWFASWVSEEAWSWWVGMKWQMVRLGVNVLSEKLLNKNSK